MPPDQTRLTVLTRDVEANHVWALELAIRGFQTYQLPCLTFRAATMSPEEAAIIDNLAKTNWLVFTSAQGVKFFTELEQTTSLDRQLLASVKIAAVGTATADAVTARGLVVSFIPPRSNAASLGRSLPTVKNRTVVLVTSNLSDAMLSNTLEKRGANVKTIVPYETVPITSPDPKFEELLANGKIGSIVLASPSAARAYLARLSSAAYKATLGVQVLTIGPSTYETATELGFRKVRQANSPGVDQIMKLLNYKP